MPEPRPRYLLVVESAVCRTSREPSVRWRFTLTRTDGPGRTTVSDREPGAASLKAELLAAVLGLEALEQPAEVTLLTSSRYLSRGLEQVRRGRLPGAHPELWTRMARLVDIHQVQCQRREPTLQRRDERPVQRPGKASRAATQSRRPVFRVDPSHRLEDRARRPGQSGSWIAALAAGCSQAYRQEFEPAA